MQFMLSDTNLLFGNSKVNGLGGHLRIYNGTATRLPIHALRVIDQVFQVLSEDGRKAKILADSFDEMENVIGSNVIG